MKIVKGEDGKDYVEFSGIVMVPTGRELDGTAMVTLRPPPEGQRDGATLGPLALAALASPSVSEMQDRLSSQVSLDVDRVMTTGSDEPVATFTAEGEQKELQEWSRANPSMGMMSVPGTMNVPEWLGALMIPGAIIGQSPPLSQGYALDGLARMRNGFDRSGWDSRGISFATIMDEAPKMKAELWMPDDEPAPPPPVRGRFQNLDFEEMP